MRSLPPLLLPLVGINLFGHIALSGGRITVALDALDAGTSEGVVGVLIGLYGVLPMLGALAMGRWIDRVGPALPLRVGIAAVIAGVALAALIPGVPVLFATAILCGLGFNLVALAAQYAIGRLPASSSAERIRHYGWLALGHSTSSVIGPLLAGVLIDAWGHRAAFAAVAGSAGVAAVLIGVHAARLAALHAPHARQTNGSAWDLVAQRSIRRIYVVGLIIAMAWDLFTFLMPVLGHRQELSASTIGTVMAAFAAGTFAVRMAMAQLVRRTSPWHVMRVAIVVIVLVYALLPLTHAVPLLFALAFCLGAAVGSAQPNMLALLHEAAPAGRGAEAVGVRALLGNASGALVPMVFGATAASLGVVPVFWGIAVVVAASLPSAHRAAAEARARRVGQRADG